MGRRDEARQEAAFNRGAVGVDGQATEEKKDVAEIERSKAREQYLKGKAFLGREFLTWLLWRSESSEALLEVDGEELRALFVGKAVLRGIAGEVVEMSARGAMAAYSPLVRQGLAQGMLIHAARLQITRGEKVFEVTLDADGLDVKSAKLPELLTDAEDERLRERLALAEELSGLIDAMVTHFLELRLSRRWSGREVPQMRAWVDEGSAGRPRRSTRGV